MKKLILLLLMAMVAISLYSYRIMDGFIRMNTYEVLQADFLGVKNDNLYILTRGGYERELFILHRDDIDAIFRRKRGDRLRREITNMVFNEPDWFNFDIVEHIEGFVWHNPELTHNDAHIEILAIVTVFAFNELPLRGVKTFANVHRQLRQLDLVAAHNAEVAHIRTSIARGIAIGDILDQDQEHVLTDIPTIPLFTPTETPEGSAYHNEQIEMATRNAVTQLIRNIPAGSTVAVIYLSTDRTEMTDFIQIEVSQRFMDVGYYNVIEMETINAIKIERGVEFATEIDDQQAINFGRILEADIIVTATLIQTGRSETLALRALNVETAATLGVARERVN